jgi:hypothetical protein
VHPDGRQGFTGRGAGRRASWNLTVRRNFRFH